MVKKVAFIGRKVVLIKGYIGHNTPSTAVINDIDAWYIMYHMPCYGLEEPPSYLFITDTLLTKEHLAVIPAVLDA